MNSTCIYVISYMCPTGRLSVLCGKHTNIGHCAQTLQPNVFMPALCIATTDCFHSVPLSLTLILAGGHKVNTKRTPLASFSYTPFFLADQDKI